MLSPVSSVGWQHGKSAVYVNHLNNHRLWAFQKLFPINNIETHPFYRSNYLVIIDVIFCYTGQIEIADRSFVYYSGKMFSL